MQLPRVQDLRLTLLDPINRAHEGGGQPVIKQKCTVGILPASKHP